MSFLNKTILCEELFNELTQFCQDDKKVNPEIWYLNYETFQSAFLSNRVEIHVGKETPQSLALFTNIVGGSGCGKTYITNFFFKPLFKIQKRISEEDKAANHFVKACQLHENKSKLEVKDEIEQDRNSFVYAYNENHNTHFKEYSLKRVMPHIFMPTNFTSERLVETFNSSKNNTLLIVCNEFDKLQENLGRTKSVSNIFTFLIGFIDGQDDLIIRKNLNVDDQIVDDGRLAILINTVPEQFEELKTSTFFTGGLGRRGTFLNVPTTKVNDTTLAEKSESEISAYRIYQVKIADIFESYYFNCVYNAPKQINDITKKEFYPKTTLRINDDDTLAVYNDCLTRLNTEFTLTNHNMTMTEKNTAIARAGVKFQKYIGNNFMVNYSYSGRLPDKDKYPMLSFPFGEQSGDNCIYKLSVYDVMRGYYEAREHFIQEEVIYNPQYIEELSPIQKRIIELLTIEIPMPKPELRARVVGGKYFNGVTTVEFEGFASQRAFYNLMNKKSKQFEQSRIGGIKCVTRYI